jgi:glutathione S-transferase
MVTARGILTETPAILAHIAQSFPQARLAPLDDSFALAELQVFSSFAVRGCAPSTTIDHQIIL